MARRLDKGDQIDRRVGRRRIKRYRHVIDEKIGQGLESIGKIRCCGCIGTRDDVGHDTCHHGSISDKRRHTNRQGVTRNRSRRRSKGNRDSIHHGILLVTHSLWIIPARAFAFGTVGTLVARITLAHLDPSGIPRIVASCGGQVEFRHVATLAMPAAIIGARCSLARVS